MDPSFILTPSPYGPGFQLSPDNFVDSPFTTRMNIGYSRPLIGTYHSLNFDPSIRTKLVKYFYYKTLDKWVYNELVDVLNYLVYRDAKVSLIRDLSEYKKTNIDRDNDKIASQKSKFIEENILSKSNMYDMLNKFVTETRTNWVDLPHVEKTLKKSIKYELTKLIENKIKSKQQGGLQLPGTLYANPMRTPFPEKTAEPPVVAIGNPNSPIIALASPRYPLPQSEYEKIGQNLRPVMPQLPYMPGIMSPTAPGYVGTTVNVKSLGSRDYTFSSLSPFLRNKFVNVYPAVINFPQTTPVLDLLQKIAELYEISVLEVVERLKNEEK